jgi:hypothetical protein
MQPEANHASENLPRFTVNLPTRSVATGAAVLNHISACDETRSFRLRGRSQWLTRARSASSYTRIHSRFSAATESAAASVHATLRK